MDIVAKNKLAFLLILIAAFLRLYRFSDFITFLGDQGRDATIINRMLRFEHFPLIGAPSSIGQVFLGPFYYYLIAPFLLLFNFNPIGLAFGVFFLSMIALTVIFFILKKEFNLKTPLLFLVFVTFSVVNINFARYSWNPNLVPVFTFFTLYFFYKFITQNKLIYALLFGSFFSFTIQLHYLAGALIIPIGLTYLINLFGRISSSRTPIRDPENTGFRVKHGITTGTGMLKQVQHDALGIIASIISFFIFISPLIIFDLRHNFLNTRNFLKMFTQGEIISNNSFLHRFTEANQFFLNFVFNVKLNPIIGLVIMLSILIITYLLIIKKRKTNLFFLLNYLNFIFFLILFSLLNSPRNPHYYGVIYYSFFLITAFLITRLKKNNLRILSALGIITLFIFLNAKGYYFFFNNANNQITRAQTIAKSVAANITKQPYQTVSLPYYETDGHIRYFLEIMKLKPLPADTPIEPAELFVLCLENTCDVLNNAQWQIAAFKNKKIAKIWEVEGVKVYKIIHQPLSLRIRQLTDEVIPLILVKRYWDCHGDKPS